MYVHYQRTLTWYGVIPTKISRFTVLCKDCQGLPQIMNIFKTRVLLVCMSDQSIDSNPN